MLQSLCTHIGNPESKKKSMFTVQAYNISTITLSVNLIQVYPKRLA